MPGICLYAIVAAASAATLEQTRASRSGERYFVELVIVADIPESFARDILEDPDRVVHVNQELVGVEHLPSPDPQMRRFRDHTRACVWLFCVDYHNTIHMRILGNRDIQLSVEPNNSKFRYGVFTWRTEPLATNRTRLTFQSESIPGFWVPTIGMLESRMRRGIISMARRMECEYHRDDVCHDAQPVDSTLNSK